MIALVAGFLLVSYLLGPGAIYRLAFSFFLPSKRLQRTRTEEVVFSAIITVIPLFLAWVVLCHTDAGRWPPSTSRISKHDAYHLILSSLVGDTTIKLSDLETAYMRGLFEQIRLVSALWLLCAIEGLLVGLFVSRYGNYSEEGYPRAICNKFLLRYVSEWEVLFTPLPLSKQDPRTQVEVDVLTPSNILYRGKLVNWFTDSDGKLAGIFLQGAARYSKDRLDRDRAAGEELPSERYWKGIPGAKLYIPASSIINYNVRYVEPTEDDIIADTFGSQYAIKEVRKGQCEGV